MSVQLSPDFLDALWGGGGWRYFLAAFFTPLSSLGLLFFMKIFEVPLNIPVSDPYSFRFLGQVRLRVSSDFFLVFTASLHLVFPLRVSKQQNTVPLAPTARELLNGCPCPRSSLSEPRCRRSGQRDFWQTPGRFRCRSACFFFRNVFSRNRAGLSGP